jgi:hypothetical protein
MLRRRVLRMRVVLLVNNAWGTRMLKRLRRRVTLLLVVGLMLHRENTHQ